MSRPVIVVGYDRGAASGSDIALGIGDFADVVFAVGTSAHVAGVRGMLAHLGKVVELTGDTGTDAASLRAHAPSAILTFSEPMLVATSRLAEALGLPFHDAATVRLLTDKAAQRARLRAAGADDTRCVPLHRVGDWSGALAVVGLPAIVKPLHGQGSRHTYAVRDATEGRELVARLLSAPDPPELVVEELLGGGKFDLVGDYVSVESATGPVGTTHLAVTGKFPLTPPFRESGQFWPALLAPAGRAAVLDLATRAVAALGVRIGLTHTEIKLTGRGPRIIEVNGRLGGHIPELARRACGADLVHLAARLALAQPGAVEELVPSDGVHFQRHGLAPTQAATFLGVQGAAEVRAMPGVSGYRGFTRAGERLPGGVTTNELDILWGVCPDHPTMMQLVAAAADRLRYEFDFGGAVRVLSGTELLR
ncbi:acetyl-CoA carboxylase biotin carboxylase subunit family protein [Amycolatopsis sp. cmx-4-68]|uniref:ATP-grasp domain-containing protein n=1 Tax=Amycolatopsis sp. cmx-4-68 TaxID=2790938 RepID=UPI00397C80E9